MLIEEEEGRKEGGEEGRKSGDLINLKILEFHNGD